MSEELNESLNEEPIYDPNEGNFRFKIPDTFFQWAFARLREPSTTIGMSSMLTSVGVNVSPNKAGLIAAVILTVGGLLAFFLREKKNLIHEGGKKEIDIDWGMIRRWFFARLKEPSSHVGIVMILAGFGIDFEEHQVSGAASALMFLLGGLAVAHEEGDRRGKLV